MYEEILAEFQEERVRYVIVGGVALGLFGSPRTTYDLDILVEMSDDNLSKIVKILKENGYSVKQPVDPMGIADARTRKKWIEEKGMKAFNFYKADSGKEVDIIIDSPVSFKEAQKSMVLVRGGGLTLPVLSTDNILKMKKEAGRDIDQLDIKYLNKIKGLKKTK
ncbi:MAG: hypothetical protein HQ593_01835 [Candidatus Omnitrophica bacterium]|nr:hypothetical protein [Candidatus Omnitrophota bacterium]